MPVSKPPKGGTLTAAGVASPKAQDNPLPPEFRADMATQHGYYPWMGDYIHPDR